jgi:diguanylate cyclase (GGDEF)-like protein
MKEPEKRTNKEYMKNKNQALTTSKVITPAKGRIFVHKLPCSKTGINFIPALDSKVALFDLAPDLILILNRQGILLDCNKPANFELYISPEMWLGKSIQGVISIDAGRKVLKCIQAAIDKGVIQSFEYEFINNICHRFFESRFVKCGENKVFAIIRDITDTKQKLNLNQQDVLTGVNNRTFFEEKLAKLRKKNTENIGIFICDVDCLKLVNDTLGHRAGDKFLKDVADILRNCSRLRDVIARIGGDEFAILTPDYHPQWMEETAAKIKAAIADYNDNTAQIPANLSVGWATSFGTKKSIDELFQEADNNMYLSKIRQRDSSRTTLIKVFKKALNTKDYIKDGHADRLQILVELFAGKLQLSPRRIDDLKLLARFHDIGKVGIPESVLFKPDRLSYDEQAVIRRHCEIGFHIAMSVPELAPIANWILRHQEWWNGQGYPLGLKGEEIPLECRIFAIADAYDAMINERPYRKAMDPTKAIEELRRYAGKQFDYSLTESFIELLAITRFQK